MLLGVMLISLRAGASLLHPDNANTSPSAHRMREKLRVARLATDRLNDVPTKVWRKA